MRLISFDEATWVEAMFMRLPPYDSQFIQVWNGQRFRLHVMRGTYHLVRRFKMGEK